MRCVISVRLKTTGSGKKLTKNTTNFDRPLRIAVGATTSQEKVRSILPKDFPCEFVVVGSSSLKAVWWLKAQ